VVSKWKVQTLAIQLRFFLQEIFQRLFGSTASGFCTVVLRFVGTSIFVLDADLMMMRKL
jgi:hypothetical protein